MTNNFYVPKNIKTERALTKEALKKVDALNLDEVLKNELTGFRRLPDIGEERRTDMLLIKCDKLHG